MRKVVITGQGVMSPLGNTVEELFRNLQAGKSGIKYFEEWSKLNGQNCFIGGEVGEYDIKFLPRSVRRAMSKMSELGYLATRQAVRQADLPLDGRIDFKRVALILGSTTGSPAILESFHKKYFENGGPEGQLSTSFFKTMNHSLVANVALAFSLPSPILSVSSACTSSTQAMILGWELLQSGLYDVVIAGGADELHPNSAAVFDVVHAVSTGFNDSPERASRPFDKKRDGLVVSEGAGVIVMETEEHALKRNVQPLARLLGGAYFCDGTHMTHAQADKMAEVIEFGLERAGVNAQDVDYVNAHATATQIGDIEESKAIAKVFGNKVPVSGLKGHLGHSLAACGAIEVISTMEMIKAGQLISTRNLDEIDPECLGIYHLQENQDKTVKVALSTNFAFGGLNSSLVISSF